MAGLSPHPVLTPQELSKRQVVAVGHLEVPVELAGLLQAVAGTSVLGGVGGRAGQGARPLRPSLSTGLRTAQGPRVALVRTPRLQAEPRVTLPLDINNYPMAKFVRCHFKVRAGGDPVTAGIFLGYGRLLATPFESRPELSSCWVMRNLGTPGAWMVVGGLRGSGSGCLETFQNPDKQ